MFTIYAYEKRFCTSVPESISEGIALNLNNHQKCKTSKEKSSVHGTTKNFAEASEKCATCEELLRVQGLKDTKGRYPIYMTVLLIDSWGTRSSVTVIFSAF